MTKRLNDTINVTQALPPSSWAAGALAGTKVNATGYGRARFVFNVGPNDNTTAALSAGIGVWQASSSGATFAAVAGGSMAAVTSGVLGNDVMVIDIPISSANPWLLISGGSVLSATINMGAIVELYQSPNRPQTSLAQQVVVL